MGDIIQTISLVQSGEELVKFFPVFTGQDRSKMSHFSSYVPKGDVKLYQISQLTKQTEMETGKQAANKQETNQLMVAYLPANDQVNPSTCE